MKSVLDSKPETTAGEKKISEKEMLLLKALLNLLLYIGSTEDSPMLKSVKGMVFTHGLNPVVPITSPILGG